MVKSKIQLYRNDANRSEVLTYNGVVLDEYCTYCTISESLYEDTFSAELDLRLPKLQKQTGLEGEVVEVVKEYAITQSQFTKPILKVQTNTSVGQIVLEDGVKLEKLSEVGDYAKVLYNGKEYYIDKNNIGNFTTEIEKIEIGENVFGYTNAEYTVLNFQPNTRVQILDESNVQNYKVKKDNVEYTIPKKITISEQVGTITYIRILVNTNAYLDKNTSSAPLFTIPGNSEVEFVDEYLNWVKVKYNGQIAFIEKVRTDRISLGTFGIITANGGLNLRTTYPSGTVLITIPKNTKIKIERQENGWIKTTYGGYTGWCSATYVGSIAEEFEERQVNQTGDKRTQAIYEDKVVDTLQSKREIEKIYQTIEHKYCETVTKEWNAIIFEEPSFMSVPIAILNPGIKVRILGKENDYYRVEYGFTTGYIMSDKLTNFTTEITYETIIKEESKEVEIRDILKLGSILKIADEYGDEIFRITNINGDDTVQTVYARQITLEDSLSLWVEDSRPTLMNGAGALEKLYTDSVGKVKEFLTYSDITETSTAYIEDKTFYDALHDTDNGFLARWGGEIERRGYKLSILKQRGNDNGVVFRRGKNYSGVSEDVQLDDLITRIIPVGFDGIQIEEKYVDSPKVNDYYNIFPREIKFEDVKYKNSPNNSDGEGFDTLEEAQEELRKRAREYFLINKCDEIKATYNIEVVDVSKTEEYKDYSIFETTWIGDIVQILDEKIGINFSSRVVSRKYDVLSEKRTTTKVSNVIQSGTILTLEDLAEKIENIQFPEIATPEIPGIQEIIEEVTGIVEDIIKQGSFGGHVVLKENEILVMDTKDVNTAKQGIVINKNGLAGFTNGYFGSYNTAITIDGQIVANAITVGKLNANLIKVGTLMSANGKSWLNMENGTFNWGDKLIFDGDNFQLKLSDGKDLETTLSDIKATANGLEIKVTKEGGNNLLNNSSFETERVFKVNRLEPNTNRWSITALVHDTFIAQNRGEKFLYMETNGGLCGVETNLEFDCSPNTTYCISMDTAFKTTGKIEHAKIFLVSNDFGGEIVIFENLEIKDYWNRQSYIFRSGLLEGKVHLKLGFTATGFSWGAFDNIKVERGEFATAWTPSANEIYQANTVINENGVTVYGHDNTSATFSFNGSVWRDNQGHEGIGIDNGGIEFMDTANEEFVGFLRSCRKTKKPEHNGVILSTAGYGDYLALGTSNSHRGGSFSSSEALTIHDSHILDKYNAGIHLWNFDNVQSIDAIVYNHTHYLQESGNMYVPTVIYLSTRENNYPCWIGETAKGSELGVFGDNKVVIGVREGTTNRSVLTISEDMSSGTAHYIDAFGSLNMNGHSIINSRSIYSLANTYSRSSVEGFSLKCNTDSIRYIYKKITSKDNKIILSLPKMYRGNPYTIINITKYSKGDVWICEEFEDRFILETTHEMVVNIEIQIDINDEIMVNRTTYTNEDSTAVPKEVKPTLKEKEDIT